MSTNMYVRCCHLLPWRLLHDMRPRNITSDAHHVHLQGKKMKNLQSSHRSEFLQHPDEILDSLIEQLAQLV